MRAQWRHLPAPARPIAVATADAITAVREDDADGFAAATGSLGALDTAQVGLVLGTLVRLALEDLHPDGLDGDDVREVLARAVRASHGWDPDPHLFLVLVAGALGVHDPDEDAEPPKPDAVARHAALLVAYLLAGRPFEGYLDRAVREIERTQLND